MKIRPSMTKMTIFHENCDRWIWPGNQRSGHESVGIFVDFLRCRAMFHYYMTRRAVSLKSNTVPRENWRPMTPNNLHTWGPVESIFLIESVGYSNCTYFSREHICIRIVFLKRWASEMILVQSCCYTTGLQWRRFFRKIVWAHEGFNFQVLMLAWVKIGMG